VRSGILALIIAGVVLLVLAPILMMGSWMMSPGGRMMGPGMMTWGHSGYGLRLIPMLFGGILSLVFIGLIVLGAYYLFSERFSFEKGEDRSVEILRERFAKGEITEEQFQKMKEQLQR
jgi:putative membrane protein